MTQHSKLYTGTGDGGMTCLLDKIVSKADPLVESYGALDELNSGIGVLLACNGIPESIRLILDRIQHELFEVGHDLSCSDLFQITQAHVERLEQEIDTLDAILPPLTDFIPPRGSMAAAQSHVVRTICRRAERAFVRWYRQEPFNEVVLVYINRLSDLLFVIARTV